MFIPPLLEVVEDVPCRLALDPAMDVMPRLPWPTSLDACPREIRLVEIFVVRPAWFECPKQGVVLGVVATVAQIDPANEANYPPLVARIVA